MLGIPQGTLIDLETTGLDANHDEIVLLGYIQGSRLEIVCRSSEEEALFTAQLAALVRTLLREGLSPS
jgi:phosphotransferase system HPr-like phosphotransfer protein